MKVADIKSCIEGTTNDAPAPLSQHEADLVRNFNYLVHLRQSSKQDRVRFRFALRLFCNQLRGAEHRFVSLEEAILNRSESGDPLLAAFSQAFLDQQLEAMAELVVAVWLSQGVDSAELARRWNELVGLELVPSIMLKNDETSCILMLLG